MNSAALIKLLENGMLDLSTLEQAIQMKERELYLKKHTSKIYQGRDGAWYTYLPDDSKKSKRRLIKRKTKEAVEDTVIAYFNKETKTYVTVKEAFTEWNERRLERGKIKPATFTRNEQIFLRHFGELENRDISTLSEEELCSFLELEISKCHLSSKSFANLKTVTRGFLKRAKKRKLIDINVESMFLELDISDREFAPRVVNDEREVFFDDEMDEIISYCISRSNDLACLGVLLMFISGLRIGEVVSLKKEDIFLDECVIKVSRTETKYKKGNYWYIEVSDYPKTPAGIRTVVIPDSYKWLLELLTNGSDGYIFMAKRGGRMHTPAIRKRLVMICNELDICQRSPHKIRKTYGSILLDNHVDAKVIEKQMGHTDISCTENYYHRDRRKLEHKKSIINGIPQFMTNGTD